MKINIKQITQDQPVSVAGGWWDDGQFFIDWCNHAGADQINEEFSMFDQDNSNGDLLGFIEHSTWIELCPRCKAWRQIGDNQWTE